MDADQRRHLETLYKTRQKRLRILEQQAEAFGLSVPAHITLEIDDLHEKIAEVEQQLGISSSPAPATTPSPPSAVAPAPATPVPHSNTAAAPAAPLEVFFSYAHKDEVLRDKLATQLQLLKRQGIIAAWHDRQISAGTEWADQISQHLDTARIILLLISADFIASDYSYDIELKRALERHDAGEARVIPIILRPTDWRSAPFGKLQALPKDAKPITTWANEDEAFLDVALGIRRVAEQLRANP
jgi:hypothetical protein